MTASAHSPAGQHDPRVHVDLRQLFRLAGPARNLSLLPRQPTQSVLNGRHASRLRGRGLNFEELRTYFAGDDIRTIDWKVTARTGKPHVRVYTEERDRPTLLLVDQRMSMFFGSRVYMKSVVAAEAAALAAHRLLAQGDRVGGLVFGDDAVAEHRPVRSPDALHRLLASIARANQHLSASHSVEEPGSFNALLESATRIAKTDYLVLIFSDFDGIDDRTERLLRTLARHNDVLLFSIADPMAEALPEGFRVAVSDGELQAEINTADGKIRERIEAVMRGRLARLNRWARAYGLPFLPMTTTRPALEQLRHLLGQTGPAR
ncbi:DUF58 domain-containing protein [Sedimentitalea sp. XS_ASV28]|uniref:DUF58 domain-containing protein n=1 Tax=Sedimentitalea sp. XS_ASV28 TaxID=3241296 RepID=UPI0035184D88